MTPTQAPNTGIEVLGPGDALSSDGFKFTSTDRLLIDRLLRLGGWAHHHDGHVALADPTLNPVVAAHTSGGTIPSRTALSLCYTLIDADGGETLPCPVAAFTTGGGFNTVAGAPTLALDTSAGTLLAADYSYALTVADGLGGETPIGPGARITVPPGSANAQVNLSNMAAILTATSGGAVGASWRLWRKRGGGLWYLIATGTADTFTDNGVAGDCTVAPPFESTITGTNSFDVTVPAGQPAAAVNFAIYLSANGSFNSPSLLGLYPIADTGTVKTFTTLATLVGAPPSVSNSFPGAHKIDPDTELVLGVKAPVATSTDLAVGVEGDLRIALDTHHIWGVLGATATTDADWTDLSGGGGGGGGGLGLTFHAMVSSTGTTAAVNTFYPVDATTTAITINLPATAAVDDLVAVFKADTGPNVVTIGNAAVVSELIDGGSTMLFVWDGSFWLPLASYEPTPSWSNVTLNSGINMEGAWGPSNTIGPKCALIGSMVYFQGGFLTQMVVGPGTNVMTLPSNCRPTVNAETGGADIVLSVIPFDNSTGAPGAPVGLRVLASGAVNVILGSLPNNALVFLDDVHFPRTVA